MAEPEESEGREGRPSRVENGSFENGSFENSSFEENIAERRIAHHREQGDLDGLIAYLEMELRSRPGSSRMFEQELIEALVARGRTERARSRLECLYRKDPEDRWVQRAILDVLIAEGRPCSSFEWAVQPKIRDLDAELLSVCADLATTEGGSIGLTEMYSALPPDFDAFAFFSIDQLAQALVRDGRFVLSLEGEPMVFVSDSGEPGPLGGDRDA